MNSVAFEVSPMDPDAHLFASFFLTKDSKLINFVISMKLLVFFEFAYFFALFLILCSVIFTEEVLFKA
jgi:hypothetical protein